jgi:hypothetical protein
MSESAREAAREIHDHSDAFTEHDPTVCEDVIADWAKIIDRHFPGYQEMREALQGSHSLLAELVKGRERFKADLPMWIESRIERAKQLITRVEAALAVARAERVSKERG